MSDNIEEFEEMTEREIESPELDQDVPEVTEMPEPPTFTTTEHTLEVDEEVSVYMQQLNLAQLMMDDKIKKASENPAVQLGDKFRIMDGDKVILAADWHFIGEFHTEKENPNIKGYEFVWGWALRPDAEEDPHVKEVAKVTEALPYGLQPLTFPLVQFPDIGIIELIKAYSFHELELDFIHIMYNSQFKSYGIFGIYNVEFTEEITKPKALDKIVEMAKKKASELRKQDPELEGPDAIKHAWQSPEILSMVAAYQRNKQATKEFAEFFKRAIMDPSLVLDDVKPTIEIKKNEKYTRALVAVKNALGAVREEELAEMEQIGETSDEE